MTGLFKLPVYFWFSFDGLYVSRNLSIFPWLSNLLPYNCSRYSLLFILHFCSVNCDFFSFIFYFIYLCFLSFLLKSLARAFSILFTLSNNQLLVLLIVFQLTFKISISSLIFIISFLLLILNFGCYFTNSFMWWVRLFIWDFPYFLKKACFAMNFPLRTAFAASHRFNMVRFHCHLPQSIFKFLLRFTIDPLAFLVACLFSLHVIVVGLFFFFNFFFCAWSLIS